MDESCPTSAWVMSHTWMHHNATTRWWRSHCTYSLMENSRHMFQHLLVLLLSTRGFLDHNVFYQSSPYPFIILNHKSSMERVLFSIQKKKQHHTHTYIHAHIWRPACAAAVQTRHSRDIPLLAWFPDSAAPLPQCYIRISHDTYMNDSHTNESWHIYEWLVHVSYLHDLYTSCTCIHHVIHSNESWHT